MINKEDFRARDAETKIKMFTADSADVDEQEELLERMSERISEVYKKCIGDNEANISPLQMMINLENRLEELFQQIESMPQVSNPFFAYR